MKATHLTIIILVALFYLTFEIQASTANCTDSTVSSTDTGHIISTNSSERNFSIESSKIEKKYGSLEKRSFYKEEYENYLKEMDDAKNLEGIAVNGLCAIFTFLSTMISANLTYPYTIDSRMLDIFYGEHIEPCPSLFFTRYISDYLAAYPGTVWQMIGGAWFMRKFFKTKYQNVGKLSFANITYHVTLVSMLGVGIVSEARLGKFSSMNYLTFANNDVHNIFAAIFFMGLILLNVYDLGRVKFFEKLRSIPKDSMELFQLHFCSLLGSITSLVTFLTLPFPRNIPLEWILSGFLLLMLGQGMIGAFKGKGDPKKAIQNFSNVLVMIIFNVVPLIVAISMQFWNHKV